MILFPKSLKKEYKEKGLEEDKGILDDDLTIFWESCYSCSWNVWVILIITKIINEVY